RIWVHLVFSTKNREPFLHKEIRKNVFQHIKQNADKKGIYLDCVNGLSEYARCLSSLNKEHSISQTAQLIKGESSHWINQNWAVGVSESHLKATRNYIFNQETHHKKRTFVEEIEEFMSKYGRIYSV
ncbi:MAG: transposase, partial [Chitinophagaceae bacterium]